MNRTLGTNIEAVYEESRVGDVRDSQADISKAKRILGYTPIVALEEGIAKTLEWCRTSGPART
jgi:UDP-N-acetylglucosamine 4-epimerase